MPSQHPVVAFVEAAVALACVAALGWKAIRTVLDNPIPREEKKRLIESYGLWAVDLAEASCPEGDVECVEREAERLYKVRRYRR